jgi:gliding motility-associated-like protein
MNRVTPDAFWFALLLLGLHVIAPATSLAGVDSNSTIFPPPLNVTDTIAADGLQYSLCLSGSALPGSPDTLYNLCPDESGEFVKFYVDPQNYCVKYQGLKCGGTEQACLVLCDDLGNCDTTFLFVHVDNSACQSTSQKIMDTLLINTNSQFCINPASLPGTVVSAANICPDDAGQSVDFELNSATLCINYTGFAPGMDQACILLTDEFGNTDTTFLCVFVRLPMPSVVYDTILAGQQATYCMDTSELAGNVVSVDNFCPTATNANITYLLNSVSLCVQVNGIAAGTDTLCILTCDNYGVCDTSLLYITVLDNVNNPCFNTIPPVAVSDSASTFVNTPVAVPILNNDDLGTCLPISLALLDEPGGNTGPSFGLAVLNANQTISYMPNANVCDVTDSFQYVLCNPVVCDTGLAVVYVSCALAADTIIVYNGFSPNGDGFNEVFKIENIQRFPNNVLKIYNRWGNLVFEAAGYNNTWDGTHRGTDLPDGTYFYLLSIYPDEQVYSGYLQLQR